MLTAANIMTNQMVSVSTETTIGNAIDQMIRENVGVLLVTDEKNEHLVGLVPGSVLLRAALDAHLRQDPVSLHMSRQYMCVESEAPIETVFDQFILHGLHFLPVVRNQRIVGLIGRQDLLQATFGQRRRLDSAKSA